MSTQTKSLFIFFASTLLFSTTCGMQQTISHIETVKNAYQKWETYLQQQKKTTKTDNLDRMPLEEPISQKLLARKHSAHKILFMRRSDEPCLTLEFPDKFQFPLCDKKALFSSVFSKNMQEKNYTYKFQHNINPNDIWCIIYFLQCYQTEEEKEGLEIVKTLVEDGTVTSTAYALSCELGIEPLTKQLSEILNLK